MEAIVSANKISLSIDELISQYETCNRVEGKSHKTITGYTEILKVYANYIRDIPQNESDGIAGFNIDCVRKYILYLRCKPKFQGHRFVPAQTKTVSDRTVQCHVRVLKAFSSWLLQENHASENVLKNLKLPKAARRLIDPLTPDEIMKAFATINTVTDVGARNKVILKTLLDTGSRASEIAGINLENVHLTDGFIKVMGKGSKERLMPIGKTVQLALLNYITQVRPKVASPGCNALFLTEKGRPITANTIKLMFARLARKSGVKRLHAHICRHTFSVNYLLNGGDIFSLQNILGHSSLDMVQNYVNFTSSQITALHRQYSPMDRLEADVVSKSN